MLQNTNIIDNRMQANEGGRATYVTKTPTNFLRILKFRLGSKTFKMCCKIKDKTKDAY